MVAELHLILQLLVMKILDTFKGDPRSPFMFTAIVIGISNGFADRAKRTTGWCMINRDDVSISHVQLNEDTMLFSSREEEKWLIPQDRLAGIRVIFRALFRRSSSE